MCGRYVLQMPAPVLCDTYNAVFGDAGELQARYNVAPTAQMPVVRAQGEGRELTLLRWGLIPAWAGSIPTGYSMINARAETIHTKRSFRDPFRRGRCVVPASGFYEWKKAGRSKHPYYIYRPGGELLHMAGISAQWTHPDTGERIGSYAIVTTEANHPMRDLHDRMPALLTEEEAAQWLHTPESRSDKLLNLLRPWPDDDISFHRVPDSVNRASAEGAHLIEPYHDLFT